jgi:hypothetical protein
MVDKNRFLFGSTFVEQSNQEVDSAAIKGFCKGLSSSNMQNIDEILILAGPS